MAESQNRTLTEQFMLRLPDGMRDRIKAAAEANNRSMNAEIVATLETFYPEPSPDPLAEVERAFSRLSRRDQEAMKEQFLKLMSVMK